MSGIITPIGMSVSFDRDPKTVALAKKLIAVLAEEGVPYSYALHVLKVTKDQLARTMACARIPQEPSEG